MSGFDYDSVARLGALWLDLQTSWTILGGNPFSSWWFEGPGIWIPPPEETVSATLLTRVTCHHTPLFCCWYDVEPLPLNPNTQSKPPSRGKLTLPPTPNTLFFQGMMSALHQKRRYLPWKPRLLKKIPKKAAGYVE